MGRKAALFSVTVALQTRIMEKKKKKDDNKNDHGTEHP